MNGRVAKRLRKIAKELRLNPQTAYAPGGKLRRRPSYRDAEGLLQQGAPIPRPGTLVECFRRAYREAKKIYKGLPPSTCVPETTEQETPFHVKVVDSMTKYYRAQN
jgi:hypothetical protein